MAPQMSESERYVLYFNESLHGLSVGAPVTILGLPVGEVTSVGLDYVPEKQGIRTRVEIMTGLRSGERTAAERLFAAVDWMPVSEEIARRAGDLGRRYRRRHPGLSLADLVVGATAMELGRTVATHNVRHFPMFARLRAPY